MNIWLTSDHHFDHANIIKYCNRPFDSVDKMNQVLIETWNDVVGINDIVYYLGDFTLGNRIGDFISILNGNICVLKNQWHHDKRWIGNPATRQLIETGKIDLIESIVVLESDTSPIVLCHYPFEIWDRKHYGSIHFHGHSHGELFRIHNRLDVGVDMAYRLFGRYRPFSLLEAIALAQDYYEKGYEE